MGYYLKLAIRHMTQRKRRTLLTLFGIAFSMMLCFVLFSAHGSFAQYAMRSTYDTYGETQLLLTNQYYVNPEGMIDNKEVTKDTINALMLHPLVKEVVLVDEWDYSLKKPDEVEKNGVYMVRIALHTPKDIKSQANEISDDIGTSIIADESVLAGLGEESPLDMMMTEISCLAVAMVCVFFAICMIRNMMVMSIAERMRDYGLYRCVGMSAKQLYCTIVVEAVILVIVSTLVGIAGCFGMFRLLESWINGFMNGIGMGLTSEFLFVWSLKPVLYMFVVGIVIVIFAIVEPCRQAMKNSPIVALNNSMVRTAKKREKRKKRYFFGLEGMYAGKNIRHKPGQFLGLLAGTFAIVFMFGTVMCFVTTIARSYEEDYSDIVPGEMDCFSIGISYDPKEEKKISQQLEALDSVSNIESYFETLSFESHTVVKYFPETLITDMAENFSEEEISYEKMNSENGVIFCKGQEESDINYQKGDSIEILTPQGVIYSLDCLYGAYENAVGNLNREDIKLPVAKDSFLEYPMEPELTKEVVRLLEEEGFSMQGLGKEIDIESASSFTIYQEIRQQLLGTNYAKIYTVRSVIDNCSSDYFIIADGSMEEIMSENYYINNTCFSWIMAIQREEEKLTNVAMQEENVLFTKLAEEYQNALFYKINSEYIAAQILLNLVRNIVFLISLFILVVAVVQMFNTTYGNMLIREKELWAFSVIGMNQWQQWKMLLLESISAAVVGAVIGYVTSWAGTFYLIKLMNQELVGTPYSYPYSWPAGMIVAYICFILLVLMVTVLFATGKRKKRVLFSE